MEDQTSAPVEQAQSPEGPSLGPNEFEQAFQQQQPVDQTSTEPAANEAASGEVQDAPQGEETQLQTPQFTGDDAIALMQEATQENQAGFQSALDELTWNYQPSSAFPDELQPYEDVINARIVDIARGIIGEMEQNAQKRFQQEQQQAQQKTIQSEVREVLDGPQRDVFMQNKDVIVGLVKSNPGLLQTVGVKGILKMFPGGNTPAPVEAAPQAQLQGNQSPEYLRGVNETLARLNRSRNAADQPPNTTAAPTAAPVSTLRKGVTLNNAIEQKFNEIVERESAGG